RPIAPVSAGVHPHATARGAGNRARELEPTQARVANTVQADRVRGAPARDQQLALDLDNGELASQPHDEGVDPGVGRQKVRPQPDRDDRRRVGRRPGDYLLQFPKRSRLRAPRGGPADPDSGQPGERHTLLDRDRAPYLWIHRHTVVTFGSQTRAIFVAILKSGAGRESAPGGAETAWSPD